MGLNFGANQYNQPKQNTETSRQRLEKHCFLKKQDFISQVYKELKIVKFLDLLYLQNHLFMSQTETNQRLANSFVNLRHCGDNNNCPNKSNVKGLLDIPFVNT